jgi:hypothetical protein
VTQLDLSLELSSYSPELRKMYLHSVKLYAVVVQGHEDDVHHDAEGDEQLRERIEHNDGKYLKIIKKKITITARFSS